MTDHCIRRGLKVRCGGLESIPELKGTLSAVVMCAVFEHLLDRDKWLQDIRGHLTEGGYFITLHPTANCYRLLGDLMRLGNRNSQLPELHGSFVPPHHTALLSIPAMHQLASRNGFEVIDISPAPQGRIGGLLGLIQYTLQQVNRAGWAVAGQRWPLVTSHIFVLKKV